MILDHATITEQELQSRRTALEESAATNRLEGLEAGPEAQRIFNRYAVGEIDLEEMGAAIDALNEQQFGSVSLPRD
jgi:hypothetical protein